MHFLPSPFKGGFSTAVVALLRAHFRPLTPRPPRARSLQMRVQRQLERRPSRREGVITREQARPVCLTLWGPPLHEPRSGGMSACNSPSINRWSNVWPAGALVLALQPSARRGSGFGVPAKRPQGLWLWRSSQAPGGAPRSDRLPNPHTRAHLLLPLILIISEVAVNSWHCL